MITSHHSFSTRIFLDEPPAAHAGATHATADVNPPENLREFWWFLRSGRGQVQRLEARSPDRSRSGLSPALQKDQGHA